MEPTNPQALSEELELRKLIAEVFESLIPEYRNTRAERRKLPDQEWDAHHEHSILGDIQLFDTYIAGYAAQIAEKGNLIQPPHQALSDLTHYQFFTRPYLSEWYFAPDNNYPKLKAYVRKLDYLRLLLMEYIEQCLIGLQSPA